MHMNLFAMAILLSLTRFETNKFLGLIYRCMLKSETNSKRNVQIDMDFSKLTTKDTH